MVYSGLGWVFAFSRLFIQSKNYDLKTLSKPSTYNTIENTYNLLDGLKNQHKSILGTC